MHHYEYARKSQDIQKKALKKYAWLFWWWLTSESIEARYLLLEFLTKRYAYTGRLEKDELSKPIPLIVEGKKLYWSLSHTKKYVWFVVDSTPTGIDIVEIEERDRALLDTHRQGEYAFLWMKNWENFCILWSAKEAIIKANWATLESMKEIVLRGKKNNDLHIFDFGWQRCTISVEQGTDYIISIYLPSEYESSI